MMFNLDESKSFVLIAKNMPTAVVNFQDGAFLESFLAWSGQYLLEKKRQATFYNNIMRHCGPGSTYSGRQNILEQLAAIYQFARAINPSEKDLLRSIISRIEERSLHCTPGFETGICDLAQVLLYTPQSLDELLQVVRQDIVKKTAILMTSDVHGHNQVFRYAASRYAVPLLNPGDPYAGYLNVQMVASNLEKGFNRCYRSANLIEELNEQFFVVLQSFGYAVNQIEPETHTKIKNYILTIFTQHPKVRLLQQVQAYQKTKEEIEANSLIEATQCLNRRGLFELSQEEQDGRLNDLQQASIPEWLPNHLHAEFLALGQIEVPDLKEAAIHQFIQDNKLFQMEAYHQDMKTKAVCGLLSFMSPSIHRWLKSLAPEIHEEIQTIIHLRERRINELPSPPQSLEEATLGLDQFFWIEDESQSFPYQQLNVNEIRKAFFNELKQRGYIQVSHELIEKIICTNDSSEINYYLGRLMGEIVLDNESSIVNLLTLIKLQSAYLTTGFVERFDQLILHTIQYIDIRQIKILMGLLLDFKMEVSFQILVHPRVLDALTSNYLSLMLRCLKEKEHQLDLVACFYAKPGFYPQAELHQDVLAALLPEYRLQFIEKYGIEFIKDIPSLIQTMKQLPRESRFQLVEFMLNLFSIQSNAYQDLLDLLAPKDRIPFCQLMQQYSPGSFNHNGFNKMIMEKLDVKQRFLYISTIMDSNHPEFHELVVKTFNLWSKQDRLAFLSHSNFFEKMNIKDFAKILVKGRFSEEDNFNFLDVYLHQQTSGVDGAFMLELNRLLDKLHLPVRVILERYTQFYFKNDHDLSFYIMLCKKLPHQECFQFLMEMSQELKQTIIENKLACSVVNILAPEFKDAYLRHFELPLSQLVGNEEHILTILKASPLDKCQQVLQELKPCMGLLIVSGYGFIRLVRALKDMNEYTYTSFESRVRTLIREFGVGEHIKEFFFDAISELFDYDLESLINAFGSKIIKIIDNQELNFALQGVVNMPQRLAKVIKVYQNNNSFIKPINIKEFSLTLTLKNMETDTRQMVIDFMLAHWRLHPISFSEFFEFLSCKGLTGKSHLIKALSREHFSGDETDLSFPNWIERMSDELDPKLVAQLLHIFNQDLGFFIRTAGQLQQILKTLLFKDQIMLINHFAPYFDLWFGNLEVIQQTLNSLKTPQACIIFLQLNGPRLIDLLQEDVMTACLLLESLPVENQLFFLSQCHFSPAQLQEHQMSLHRLSNPLIQVFFSLIIEEMNLNGHGFFEANHLSLIQQAKAILCKPQQYSRDEILATVYALPITFFNQINNNPLIMAYLLEQKPEPSAKKLKKCH